MHLQEYLHAKRGRMVSLARLLNINYHYLYSIAAGIRKASVEMALKIENATQGEVTRKDLRPHDWFLIWPELAEKEARKTAAVKKKHHNKDQTQEGGIHA